MKKVFLCLLLSAKLAVFSQVVKIGQDAAYVKSMIEYKVKSYYQANGPHTVKMNTDTRYLNGKISDVILCYENQYRMDLRIITSFCEHYIMTDEKLTSIITQYEKVSIEKMEELYGKIYGDRKIDKYYFTEDFKHYKILFLADNGYPSVEEKNTNLNELPVKVKDYVEKKLKEAENAEKIKQAEMDKRIVKEKEIKSKTYNIKELNDNYNKGLYSRLVKEQQVAILDCIKESAGDLTVDFLNKAPNKYFEFSNIYSVNYKLIDKSTPSEDYGTYIKAGSKKIDCESKFKNTKGTDTNCIYVSRCVIKIPTVYVENIEVMTEMSIDNITVNYVKGISKVKIKEDKIEYLENEPPLAYREYLTTELLKNKKGKHLITYEYINVMEQPEITIIIIDK